MPAGGEEQIRVGVLAIGGLQVKEDEGTVLRSCEAYDHVEDCWHEVSGLTVARSNSSAC